MILTYYYSSMCGRFPFQSNVASKLEELVQEGKLTFYEIEWINVSQAGMNCETLLSYLQ